MSSRDTDAARARAEANFRKKEESRAAAALVMAGVEAAKEAELAKTARLRALRLAKEAADREATLSSTKPATKASKSRTLKA